LLTFKVIRRIAGLIVSVLVLSAVDHKLELRLGQTKEFKCAPFSVKH